MMDIEQLKLILDAAAAAGDGAMQIVLMWFGLKLLTLMFHYSTVGGLIYAVYSFVCFLNNVNSFRGKTASILGVTLDGASSSDMYVWTRWLSERHKEHPFNG